MSRQKSSGLGSRPSAGAHRRLGHVRSVAVTVALIAGVAACGGDDDDAASDSTSAPDSSAVETTSAPDTTTAPEITAPDDTTGAEPSDTTTDDTTTDGTAATDDTTDGSSPDDAKPETAGPGGTAPDTTDGSDGATANAAAASESSGAEGAEDTTESDTTDEGANDGSAADVGPTTTGPECEFEENTSLPLERCDMGPAVGVVQSILQANGYEISTVDGMFGDQTLYAVRAFQEEEGIEVDGIVGIQTWTALGVDEQFGNDANGDGVIAPDELDLTD